MAISAGDAIIKIGGDAGDLDSELKKVDGAVSDTCAGIEQNFAAAGAAVMAFGVIVTAVLGAAVKQAADFEKGMREVNTMMLLSEQIFHSFSEEVRDLAFEMGINAVEATHALYQAISAGVPKENAIEFLRVASQAAIGGVTDTETAVDGLTTVINAFKMSVEDAQWVADIMFTTVKGGKTTFEELSASLFNVAPIAKASGVSFEEVAAALATLTKQGVPTNVATTQLRQAIMSMTAPTVEQQKKLEALGLEMSVEAMRANGLAGQMAALYEATGGSLPMLRQLIGATEGVAAVIGLAGENAQMFASDLAAMGEAAGASAAAYEQMTSTFSFQFDMMKERLVGLAIVMGDVLLPPLTWVIKRVNEFVAWIKTLNPVLFKVVTIGLAVSAAFALMGGGLILLSALAPTLIKILGTLSAMTIPKLLVSLRGLIVTMWHLVASFLAALAALGPVGWAMLATGIGLIITGVVLASKYSNQATASFEEMGAAADDTTLSLKDGSAALDDYNAQVAAASGGLGDFEMASLDAADAQGALGSSISTTTSMVGDQTSQLRALALVLGDVSAYFRSFGGGMLTPAQAAGFTGEQPRMGVRTAEGEEYTFAEWWHKYAQENPAPAYEAPTYQHGTILFEPTALWGLRSKSLLGIAGEAGPEPVGPTVERMGQTIHNDFHIATLVVREEPDVKKIAVELQHLQVRNYRKQGISG